MEKNYVTTPQKYCRLLYYILYYIKPAHKKTTNKGLLLIQITNKGLVLLIKTEARLILTKKMFLTENNTKNRPNILIYKWALI